MATINVTKCEITPNDCPLTDPLSIAIEFTTDKDLDSGIWALKYEVDFTGNRHILDVATMPPTPYPANAPHRFTFSVPKVDVAGVKEKSLLNMGILRAVLSNGAEHVSDITMVVQVAKPGDVLMRRIISPLE
eukprot:TRINITY_DN6087_c0_g1_i1.p3 TRINITY_DN6087_c0_g1~~TRINITY_DN6087_c0_g1_i1.p3  ORF type:complete len:144 (+),score=65.18 TRINITY_DN6087_c0_g1_i1:37-432(+)